MGKKQLRDATDRPDWRGNSRMRRYHPWRQKIELRTPNRGKAITDSLTTVTLDPVAMDLAAELEPLPRVVHFLANFPATMLRLEAPKWARRHQLGHYGGGIMGGILRMQSSQALANRFRVARSRQTDLNALKQSIRDYAASQGFALCGVTRVDRRFIADGQDDAFPYDTALVLGMEMDAALLDEMPSPGDKLVDFEVYVEAGKRVFDVANFIRRQGYRCVARIPFDGQVKYPPHAVMAGLAELGANGVALTPQFGPRQRWCMISVEAELAPDPPADFGFADYCEACRLCVYGCPGRAISTERIWWRGVYKHKVNTAHCWPYFVKFEGCAICLKVCPFHRFGYEACMAAYQADGTILGRPKGIDRFLARQKATTLPPAA